MATKPNWEEKKEEIDGQNQTKILMIKQFKPKNAYYICMNLSSKCYWH